MQRMLSVAIVGLGLVLAPAMSFAAEPVADKAAEKAVEKTADKTAPKTADKAIDQAAEKAPEKIRTADVVYVPTPNDVVEKMLEWADVKKDDLLYDLGSGDGRIVVTAAKKFGCKAVGYEIDPDRINEARANIKKRDVGDLAKIVQEDIFKLDVSPANVVTMYLLPDMEKKLLPQLQKLKAGSRIVVHDYPIPGIKPDKEATMTSKETNVTHHIYLYTLPMKEE
jgi:tRNA G37 N-methylase Trm5